MKNGGRRLIVVPGYRLTGPPPSGLESGFRCEPFVAFRRCHACICYASLIPPHPIECHLVTLDKPGKNVAGSVAQIPTDP